MNLIAVERWRQVKKILEEAGTSADVMKRIATPMVGGMMTSVAVVLLVYPAIYYIWKGWRPTEG